MDSQNTHAPAGRELRGNYVRRGREGELGREGAGGREVGGRRGELDPLIKYTCSCMQGFKGDICEESIIRTLLL